MRRIGSIWAAGPQKEIKSDIFLPKLFHFLKVIMLFMDKNSRRIGKLDDEGWVYDVPFL
jgi:hypothetical protein